MMTAAGCERINDTLRVGDKDDEETVFETTALLFSSGNGHTEVVELLIGAKADVNKCAQVDLGLTF